MESTKQDQHVKTIERLFLEEQKLLICLFIHAFLRNDVL